MSTRLRCCAAALALAAGVLTIAPLGQARTGANLSLIVNFSPTGLITVTLPDGTPVGTTSGAPTVIPAGFYTIVLNGPGECINLPLWELQGPGVNIADDMKGGETDTHALYATFLPNATYTWHSDRNQSVVYTFRASSDVVGTVPKNSGPSQTGSGSSLSDDDIVGSDLVPFRGTIVGAVSPSGRLTLAYKGRSVSHLKAGRYMLTVSDESSTSSFILEKGRHPVVSVTGTSFVGKRSMTVRLTAGRWDVAPRPGAATYAIDVS